MIVVRRTRGTVTKRLVLVEEVRVKKIRREAQEPQNVKLPREDQ
jgi:hypothetical protein